MPSKSTLRNATGEIQSENYHWAERSSPYRGPFGGTSDSADRRDYLDDNGSSHRPGSGIQQILLPPTAIQF